MPVLVVESPAKAKTIEKYLKDDDDDYKVLASFGHVRDLPPKDGSVLPEQDFSMGWEVSAKARPHIKKIADALKADNALILATDPDREGEAISWHLYEELKHKRVVKDTTPVHRVAFNAVTKTAVREAIKNPRSIDMHLVDAYLARRALDYLVGFNLSPVLWRKLPGARSAGRVQSVALRLVVEREMEINTFQPREYWSVHADLLSANGQSYRARLMILDGHKLDKYDLPNAAAAQAAVEKIESVDLFVTSIEEKSIARNPQPPFMTSTLQQEANRKLHMGATETMRTAQKLYEAGHITYMRTDGVDMAPEALTAMRAVIADVYGSEYLAKQPRVYKNKAKNAQEAHECIRPTALHINARAIEVDDSSQRQLYDLIWRRALASQMASAIVKRTTADLADNGQKVVLRANGHVPEFDGFLKVYEEGRDTDTEPQSADMDSDTGASTAILPPLKTGEAAQKSAVHPLQHFTQPPPRYSEASLIKQMESLGIGRPSTYAAMVSTIQDRDYVRKERGKLFAEDKGRLVTVFLMHYFQRYVEYDFTAGLEGSLDAVSAGDKKWKSILSAFWDHFSKAVDDASSLRITEVLDTIDSALSAYIYPPAKQGDDPKLCPQCKQGRLHLKTSRGGGAFVGCGQYPECTYTRDLAAGNAQTGAHAQKKASTMLGHDADGTPIFLLSGRYGPYVQKGENNPKQKPPRASLPKHTDWQPDAIDLDKALQLLSLPRTIGEHPEGGIIECSIGPYGAFLKHNGRYANFDDIAEVFTMGMNRAIEILAAKQQQSRRAAPAALRELGEHPNQGGAISVMDGKYGAYVKWGKINATLPKGTDPLHITVDDAVRLIAEKQNKKKPAQRRTRKS